MLAGVLLSIAWLRTHGLWLPWGLHFAWNASLGILFGLPVSGDIGFLHRRSYPTPTAALAHRRRLRPRSRALHRPRPHRRHRRSRPHHPRLRLELHPRAHRPRRLPHGRRTTRRPRRNGASKRRPPPISHPDPSHHSAEPLSRRRTQALTGSSASLRHKSASILSADCNIVTASSKPGSGHLSKENRRRKLLCI